LNVHDWTGQLLNVPPPADSILAAGIGAAARGGDGVVGVWLLPQAELASAIANTIRFIIIRLASVYTGYLGCVVDNEIEIRDLRCVRFRPL
jgi:hypothetical protein